MRRWPVRSALYIDFENVPLSPEAIASWLAWLEDGCFDAEGRRRRFLQKRVYWNSHAERHRQLFEAHGFAAVLIGKFSGLKNGADIRMAMDVVEATYTRSEIDEYILLTGDSDFVPVLERLREKAKRSAIVATEHRPNIHTTYQLHADLLIPSRRLTAEAAQYNRPRRGLLARLFGRGGPAAPRLGPAPAPRKASEPPKAAKAQLQPQPQRPEPETIGPGDPYHPSLEAALERVQKLLAQQPRNFMAQRRVLAELDKVRGFKRQGAAAFLGLGSYRALMREMARRDSRIAVVEQPGGGTGVVFIPPTPPLPPKPVAPVPAPLKLVGPAAAPPPGRTANGVAVGEALLPDPPLAPVLPIEPAVQAQATRAEPAVTREA